MGAVRIHYSIREFVTQPVTVILWILLGGKPKWLLLNFGFNDVMRTAPQFHKVASNSVDKLGCPSWLKKSECKYLGLCDGSASKELFTILK